MSLPVKIQHIWSILSESSVIDQDTNNVSLINIVEELQVTLPKGKVLSASNNVNLVSMKCELVSLWKSLEVGKEHVMEIKVSLYDPSNKQVLNEEPALKLHFQKGIERFRSRVRFDALPITTPGTYTFKLYAKDNKNFIPISETPFSVKIALSQKN